MWQRLQTLAPFLIGAYVIAFIQWAWSPTTAFYWWPSASRIPDDIYVGLPFILAFIWLLVVAAGFKRCGWPSLLMLLGIKYGLFPFWMWGMLTRACVTGSDCL